MGLNDLDAGAPQRPLTSDQARGCLLGGAVGDALGAPVEFLGWTDIRERFGDAGLQEPASAYGRPGAITDDTQMTLFTAEGLLRALTRDSHYGIVDVPGVLLFCQRPPAGELGLDALGGIQFAVPSAGHWDYRPGINRSGDHANYNLADLEAGANRCAIQ